MKWKIWPANSFDVHTAFSPNKVLSVLQINTEPKKLFRMTQAHTYFEGECSREGFKINRIIHYRNSFLPRICGVISPEGSGSLVKIKMTLYPLVAVFLTIWFAGVIAASVVVIETVLSRPAEAKPMMFVPLAMLIFGVALVSGGFWFEAGKQQDKLTALIKG